MPNSVNPLHLSPAWLAMHQADCEEPRIELGEDFGCKEAMSEWFHIYIFGVVLALLAMRQLNRRHP